MTLEQSVELVMMAMENAVGGEIFIPKIPSMKIVDLAKAIIPDCTLKTIGIRPGEKVHEILISEDEARKAKIFEKLFVITPQFFGSDELHEKYGKFSVVPEGFTYRSDENDQWLTIKQITDFTERLKLE
jgi:UDP-N-acetylglucosamine 4,6-dehydratase